MSSVIVLFGATGDLAQKKLLPALYYLHKKGTLGKATRIACVSRRPYTKKKFLDFINLITFVKTKTVDRSFYDRIDYVQLDWKNPDLAYLYERIEKVEKRAGTNNKVFYLALPPQLYSSTTDIIDRSHLLQGKGWKRVVFEKPFGHDLKSARRLNEHITRVFREEQIYRIDHYLAKELVENIFVFRFANSIFERIWHKECIDHVQITVAEQGGVEGRASYYDHAGAVRDMVQSHLLQVLALTAMEPPKSLRADDIRDRKVDVFRRLRCEGLVFGQYSATKNIPSYREDVDNAKSRTESFAALKIFVDAPRWKNVPFYLRTGKRLERKFAEVNIVLKDIVCDLFCEEHARTGPNVITVRIQPDEGLAVKFNAKIPGPRMALEPVQMEFCHACRYALKSPESYELLLYEVLLGDQTLFTRWDSVELCWKFVDRVLSNSKLPRFPNYAPGSMGPKAAEQLIKKDGREWYESEDIKRWEMH